MNFSCGELQDSFVREDGPAKSDTKVKFLNAGTGLKRISLLFLGWLCVALGLAGLFLPVLPTTPFLLVALWAFGRSSPRFAGWVRDHPRLGPYVRDWERHRVIPPRAKLTALALMALSFSVTVFATEIPTTAKAAVGIILVGAGLFIVTRRSHP